jgi:curli biogenesis system outer membrane secretion channel CsgG
MFKRIESGIDRHNKADIGLLRMACFIAVPAVLAGCLATNPSSDGASATAVTGAAAGESTAGANSALERCPETLGTLRIEENTNASWYGAYSARYGTGSTVPMLRTLVQQSNCFVILERGGRATQNIESEQRLSRGDEARAGSNVGPGQVVVADYSMSPEVMLSDRGGTRAGAGVGGLLSGLGNAGRVLGAVGGSMSTNEAGVVLLLVDIRSRVQIAAAEGYSKNVDFGFAGGLFGGSGAGGGGGFTRTPQGKVVAAAFIDSYNKMVVALREYKAQTVKGGLGTGGRLGVQGGSTPAAKDIPRR